MLLGLAIRFVLFSTLLVFVGSCDKTPIDKSKTNLSPHADRSSNEWKVDTSRIADVALRKSIAKRINEVEEANLDGDALGKLAMVYDANGLDLAAEKTYQLAAEQNSSSFNWHYLLAIRLFKNGKLNSALASAERALNLDPTYLALHMRLGNWSLDRGDSAAALAAFKRASELGVGPAAELGAARAHLHLGQRSEAFEILNSVVARSDHPVAHRLLSNAWRAIGEEAKARDSLKNATESRTMWFDDPIWDEVLALSKGKGKRLHDIELMLGSGLVGEALSALRDLENDGVSDLNVHYHFALAYFQSQRFELANQHLRRALELEPVHYPSHLLLASLYQRDEDNETAAHHLKQVVEIFPKLQIAHQELGFVQLRLGDSGGALNSFETAIELDSVEPNVHYYAGVILGDQDQCGKAMAHFETAIVLDPNHAKAQIGKATCLEVLGRKDQEPAQSQTATQFSESPR